MSNISELANAPELSFINNMTLQETEELVRENFVRAYREITGRDPEMSEASIAYLIAKAFCAVEYQTMQYVDAKGRAELLKTSTGNALDGLANLLGLTRTPPNKATAMQRFTVSEAMGFVVAIPAGTRVKTQDGKYFATLEYAEIKAGETSTETMIEAEVAGTDSDEIMAGTINILVDPIPYVASTSNTTPSTGGLDTEDDDKGNQKKGGITMQSEKPPRSSYEPLRLRVKIDEMIQYGRPLTKQFSRKDRDLADDMRQCMLQMYRLAIELEKKYYRKTTTKELDIELEWLRHLVRMAASKDYCGVKYAPPLSMHQYEVWSRLNDEIGRMIGGYIGSLEQ